MPQTEYTNAIPIGTRLLDYEILEVLGEGGFGIAYKVKDIMLNKIFAIKEYMPSEYVSRSAYNTTVVCNKSKEELFKWGRDRFLQEAQTLALFDHPSIVKIHRAFEANNTAYFVMDYYEGETLESYLKRHPNKEYNQDEILSIVMPILEGLKVVHSKGFLHRDIAPDNIFLRVNKLPVLIVFGASRNALGQKSKSVSAIVKQGYSPPEQYTTTSSQDATTDLYAVSAVIYRMVTGNKPTESTHRQIEFLNGNSDPIEDIVSKYKDRYSKSFLETVQKGLNIRQKDRVQTVSEYQDGLVKDVVEEEKKEELPSKKPPKNPCKALDDLIMLAGSDEVITKKKESMILKKARELGLDESKAKECIDSAIKKYGWKRKDIGEVETEKKSEKKSNQKTYINPCKALEDSIMLSGSDKVITKDDIETILQKARELNIEEDRAKACIDSAIKKYEWKREGNKSKKGVMLTIFIILILIIIGTSFWYYDTIIKPTNLKEKYLKKKILDLKTDKNIIKEYIKGVIKNGSNYYKYPLGAMPPALAVGKDAEDVAAYVAGGLKGNAPDTWGICASCHGEDGKGNNGISPNLTKKPLLGIQKKIEVIEKQIKELKQ